jgi:hypothetical protein
VIVVEVMLAALFGLLGIRSAVASLRQTEPEDSASTRLLVAIHGAAGAGAWFALSGAFIGSALVARAYAPSFRWFGVVAIALAGVRMLVSYRLSTR